MPTANKFPGACHECGRAVPAGAGTIERTPGGRRARWLVFCQAHGAAPRHEPDPVDMAYEDACARACGFDDMTRGPEY